MARRIVPELISPSQAVAVQPAFEFTAEQPVSLRINLKEQAELAKTLLDPGRKLYVDVSQESKVNWRKLQKAAGVKKVKPQRRAPALQMPADTGQPFQVPLARGGGSNIFASVVERLEAGLAMPRTADSDESESEPDPEDAPEPNSGSESEGGDKEDYAEYDRDFIDDTEVHEYFGGDWHKPKHSGFYINQGDIEKTDELLLSDEPDEPEARKRKVKPKQGKGTSPSKGGVKIVVKEIMGKDGKMKKVRRKVNADGTPVPRKAKPAGEAGAKPAKRAKQAANGDTAVNQLSTTVPAFQQALDATAQGTLAAVQCSTNPGAAVAAAPQLALPVVEDKAPASMLSGGIAALPSRTAVASVPTSPIQGMLSPQAAAPARTPLTGKKRPREGPEGAVGYEIPADVRSLLDQLRMQAEALGLPKEGDPALEEPPLQPGEDRPQKKLPSDLNPLLAKIAKAAARDNNQWGGARTTIANAAHSFLHPWTQKGNMAVRLKKLHESAQARHDKSVSWLLDAVANKQQPGLAGPDDDFATSSQQPQAAATAPAGAPADDPAVAPAGGISSLPWNEQHKYALVNFVTTMFEVNDGRDDDPELWEQLAARMDLWGPYKVTPAELQQVYVTNKHKYFQEDFEGQPKKRARRTRPLSGTSDNPNNNRLPSLQDDAAGKAAVQPLSLSQTPSQTPSLSPTAPTNPLAHSLPAIQPLHAPVAGSPIALGAGHAATAQNPLPQLQPQLQPGVAQLQSQPPQLQPQLASSSLPAGAVQTSGQAGADSRLVLAEPSAAAVQAALQQPPAGAVQTAQQVLPSQLSGALSQQVQADPGEGPAPPSKEEFLQFGVEHGGNRDVLTKGLSSCREGTIKEITYKVLLQAGPAGMKKAHIVDKAKDMGLVAADWVTEENRNSRSSQVSNAIRHSDMFTHVGDHKYAIASFPGVQPIPLKISQGTQGKRSGGPGSSADLTEMKQELPSAATAPLSGPDALAAFRQNYAASAANSHPSASTNAGATASAVPSAVPIPSHIAPDAHPVLFAAYNQSLGQGGAQGQPALQSLLAAPNLPVQPVPSQDIKPNVEQAQ